MTDFDASDDPFGSQSTPKRSANNDFDDFLAEPQPTVGKSSAPPMDDFFAETSTAPVVAAPVVSAPVVPVVPVENALTCDILLISSEIVGVGRRNVALFCRRKWQRRLRRSVI